MSLLLTILAIIHSLYECHGESKTYESTIQNVGNSEFVAFYTYKTNQDQQDGECNINDKLGIYFESSAISQLPIDFPDNPSLTQHTHSTINCSTQQTTISCCGQEHTFTYPSINNNKFKHLFLSYNPEGRRPPGVYDVPHIDFHWYFITATDRETTAQTPTCNIDRCDSGMIPFGDMLEQVTCSDLDRCNIPTIDPERFMPGGCEVLPFADSDSPCWFCLACVPGMGIHCTDPAANTELTQGKQFDDTFFMTRWDGIINSNEAMITLASYEKKNEGTKAEKCVSFMTPLEYVFGNGCYPTSYCYGCGVDTEFGKNKCWAYLTDYEYKGSIDTITPSKAPTARPWVIVFKPDSAKPTRNPTIAPVQDVSNWIAVGVGCNLFLCVCIAFYFKTRPKNKKRRYRDKKVYQAPPENQVNKQKNKQQMHQFPIVPETKPNSIKGNRSGNKEYLSLQRNDNYV